MSRCRPARKREALLVLLLAKRADKLRSAIRQQGEDPPPPNRRHLYHIPCSASALCTPPRSVASLAQVVSRRPPHRHTPCVVRSPALFLFPVSNSPAGGEPPAANRRHLCHAVPLHATPKCYFSRAGGFPKAPAPAPPVCSPFAGAFQRPRACVYLAAHEELGLCVLYLPAIGAFQRHA
jgi:hypothetical protein